MQTVEQEAKHFGRNAIQIRANYGKFIGVEQMMRECPAVFAEHKHESRSERFAFISTQEVLEAMRSEGFFPVEITIGGSKDRASLTIPKQLSLFAHR